MNQLKFKPGEGEQMVKEIHRHLREADYHCEHGNWLSEERERDLACQGIEKLIDKLATRFQKYAWKFLGTSSQSHIDDAIREMGYRVVRRVNRSDNTPGTLFFETHFNKAVECCINDAIDYVKSHYLDINTALEKQEKERLRERGDADPKPERALLLPTSLNDLLQVDGSEEDEKQDMVEDESGLRSVKDVLTEEIWKQFLREMEPKDRKLMTSLRLQATLEQAARFAGMSLRTAQDHRKVHAQRLLELLGLPPEKGVAVDEASAEFRDAPTRRVAKGRTQPRAKSRPTTR